MSQQGIVAWFDDKKGFGFVKRAGERDVFVHHSQINAPGYRTLDEGDTIEFDIVEGPKGLQAENVFIVQKAVNH
jgi:CspA family cold shock protein